MHKILPSSLAFSVMLLLTLLLSSCGVFSNEYGYNSSRGGQGIQDRPLYEEDNDTPPVKTPTSGQEDNDNEDVELIFEEDTDADEEPELPSSDPPKATGTKEARLRQEAVDYAKTFLGTKYKLGGTTPKGGFDCSGFTSYIMKEVDIALSRTSGAQERNGEKVRVKKVQPGDLIFYRRSALGEVFHVSLVVANKSDGIYVIHSTSRGVVIDNISKSSYWSPKISSARSVF